MQSASFSLPDRESSSARIEGADQGRGAKATLGVRGCCRSARTACPQTSRTVGLGALDSFLLHQERLEKRTSYGRTKHP